MRIGISAGVGKNKTIRDALQEQGLSLDYVCGGIGRCGKCVVRVVSGHVPVTGSDRAFFSKEALEQEIGTSGKVTFSRIGNLPETDYLKVTAVGNAHFLTGAVTAVF